MGPVLRLGVARAVIHLVGKQGRDLFLPAAVAKCLREQPPEPLLNSEFQSLPTSVLLVNHFDLLWCQWSD
jgi:hypothetical protein